MVVARPVLWAFLLPLLGSHAFVPVVAPCRMEVLRFPIATASLAFKDTGGGKEVVEMENRFQRAVECAQNEGLCDPEELLALAKHLQEFDGCYFELAAAEGDEDNCEKEALDRLDVADLLRSEGETKLRRETVKFSNLFKEQVEKQIQQKLIKKEVIDTYNNYYACIFSMTGME